MKIVKSSNLGLHIESCINEILRKICQFGRINAVMRLLVFMRNSKNIFLKGKKKTGFKKMINLIFSLFNEGDNNVFSPLRSENDLFI